MRHLSPVSIDSTVKCRLDCDAQHVRTSSTAGPGGDARRRSCIEPWLGERAPLSLGRGARVCTAALDLSTVFGVPWCAVFQCSSN